MSLQLVTPPAGRVLTLARVKQHCRVEHNADDELLLGLIDTATQALDAGDGWLGRALVPQTWRLGLDRFPCPAPREIQRHGLRANAIRLPLPPLLSVTSLRYTAPDGSDTLLSPGAYTVQAPRHGAGGKAELMPAFGLQWPATRCVPDAVRIEFQCGYAPLAGSPVDHGSGVPAPIRQAMLLWIAQWYDNRADVVMGAVNEMPNGAQNLLAPFRDWQA